MMTSDRSLVGETAIVGELELGLRRELLVGEHELAADGSDLLGEPADTRSMAYESTAPSELLGFIKGVHSAEDDDLDEDDVDDDDDDDFVPDDADDLEDEDDDDDDDDDDAEELE